MVITYQLATWFKNSIRDHHPDIHQPFSFIFVRDYSEGSPPKLCVYYAFRRQGGANWWPSPVVLLQSFARKPDIIDNRIWCSSNPEAVNPMCVGMAQTFRYTLSHPYANLYHYDPNNDTHNFNGWIGHRRTGNNIYDRPKLLKFNNPSTGPDPVNVDLGNTAYNKEVVDELWWEGDQLFYSSHNELKDFNIHRIYMLLAFNRVMNRRMNHPGLNWGNQNYNIGAVFARASGKVECIAYNTAKDRYTYHAEVNLIQAMLQKYGPALPDAPYIYTTLKPCKMCHSMIRYYCPNAVVMYSQNDPGDHAQYPGHDHTFQLGTQFKPVRPYFYDSGFYLRDTGQSLGGELDRIRGHSTVVNSLRSTDSTDVMSYTSSFELRRLEDKYFATYKTNLSEDKNNALAEVLNHLSPAFRVLTRD